MTTDLNFSTQFFPKVNDLKKWTSDVFYPYIKTLNERTDTFRIYNLNFNDPDLKVSIPKGSVLSFEEFIEELKHFDKKAGLYGVSITSNDNSAFIYIGKSKNLKDRVRQHLTGKNSDGSKLSSSTATKFDEICNLSTSTSTQIKFFVWTNKKLTNSPNIDYELGILEALLIAKSKDNFLCFKSNQNLNLEHWNLRVG